ncbi:MAG: sugar phosphate nucleotidyltransferase [Acidobacteriota bacterium]|jgi:mannose-1-phosphate guanylyltransferase
MSNVYAVIMAGGRGERFWPLSNDRVPKPFIPLLGPRTLIQQTVERLLPLLPRERILISIGEAQSTIAGEQLPQIPPENFIVEPVGRDTAPCLGYCALHIERRDPDGILLAVPADHYISDAPAYRRMLDKGIGALAGAAGVVFGIRPTRPETGYGYVQAHKPESPDDAWPVVRFVEKPDAVHAREYLAVGNYFWNGGIFLWRNRTLLSLLQEHMPELYRGLEILRPLIGRREAHAKLHATFAALPRISIDFGVVEKTPGLRLVPAEFAWDDIGNWGALERALPHDAGGNVAVGPHLAVEAGGCIAYSDAGTIATFGVSNLIVVQSHGRVLVCAKDRAADLKRLLASLGAAGTEY